MRIQTTVEIRTSNKKLAKEILSAFQSSTYEVKSFLHEYSITLLIDQGENLYPDNLEELNKELSKLKKQ